MNPSVLSLDYIDGIVSLEHAKQAQQSQKFLAPKESLRRRSSVVLP